MTLVSDLLVKARRDTSKLVQVQRTVTRGGKTFIQNFWVSPSQVKATDRVIGNAHNLIPTPGSVPVPPQGVFDQAYFDSIKSDRTKALDYLKSCGITWQANSHAGINWMRALQAVKNAQAAGTLGAGQGSGQPKGQPAQKTPFTPLNADPAKAAAMITPQIKSELDAATSSRQQVVILKKKLGQQGCMEYAQLLGITWAYSDHAAINNMRMTMALQQYLDGNGGGAPLGNQNAQQNTPATPPVDPDELVVPQDASDATKAIIAALNSITDHETLQLAATTGFVAEDAEAKEFVKDTLLVEYKRVIGDPTAIKQGTSATGYIDTVDDPISNMFSQNIFNTSGTGAKDALTKLYKGMSATVLDKLFTDKYIVEDIGITDVSIYQLTNPRESMDMLDKTANNNFAVNRNTKFLNILDRFKQLNQYTGFKYADSYGNDTYATNSGARTSNTDILKQQFDMDKEGFVNVIRQIAKAQPDLADAAETMEQNYEKLIKSVNYDTGVLETLRAYDYPEIKKLVDNYNRTREMAHELYDALINAGYSKEIANATLERAVIQHSNNTGDFKIQMREPNPSSPSSLADRMVDPQTGQTLYFDLNQLFSQDDQHILYRTMDSWAWGDRSYVWNRDNDIDPNANKGGSGLVSLNLTEDKFNEIHNNLNNLMGVKLVDKTTRSDITVPISEIDDWSELVYTANSDDDKMDALLSNILVAYRNYSLNYGMLRYRTSSRDSKANKNGRDYSGNYDYVADSYDVYNNLPGGLAVDGPKINARIAAQMDNQITYSSDHFKHLKDYVKNVGDGSCQQPPKGWRHTRANYPDVALAQAASVSVVGNESINKESNPAKDMFVDTLLQAARYCPQNYNKQTTTPEQLRDKNIKTLGYEHYHHNPRDFSNIATPVGGPQTPLRKLRESALASAHCTLAKTDSVVRTEVEHDVKMHFDRIDPKTGKRVPKHDRVYDDRTLVFHSGVYEIKNQTREEAFRKQAADWNETPQTCYHGTSYGGACGIVGVDGAFRYKSSSRAGGQHYTGAMLGEGIYLGKMTGKLCPYIGNDKYGYTSYTASTQRTTNNVADGVILVCDTLLGNHKEFTRTDDARYGNKNHGGSYDSVAVGAGALMSGGSSLKEYEMCVTNNNMVLPRYMVDCGSRRR